MIRPLGWIRDHGQYAPCATWIEKAGTHGTVWAQNSDITAHQRLTLQQSCHALLDGFLPSMSLNIPDNWRDMMKEIQDYSQLTLSLTNPTISRPYKCDNGTQYLRMMHARHQLRSNWDLEARKLVREITEGMNFRKKNYRPKENSIFADFLVETKAYSAAKLFIKSRLDKATIKTHGELQITGPWVPIAFASPNPVSHD